MIVIAVLLALLVFSQAPASAASCESLTSVSLPHTTITSAQSVAAGAFAPPVPALAPVAPDGPVLFGT